MIEKIERILVIQLRQLGDVLVTTPALRAIRKKFPSAKIAFLVDKKFEPLLRYNPHLDLIISRDPEEKFEPVKTIRRVRKFAPDVLIDYLANPRTTLISFLSGAKITLASAENRRAIFYKLRVPSKGKYVPELKISLLEPLGISEGELGLVFNFPESAKEKITKMLQAMRISGKFMVALDLFHKRPARQWPVEFFIEIADRLVEYYQAEVVITCLPENRSRAEQALKLARQKHYIASELDLFELCALIGKAKLLLGGDAGPKHIAVSQDTPSFTILGPSGRGWTPPSEFHQTAFLDLDCRPCGYYRCPKPDHPCERGLSPEMVWEKLKIFIESKIL